MPEDQSPRGRFGLPRITDVLPNVSHHRADPSTCDIKRCYDGHTKEDVVRSVLEAYKVFSREVERNIARDIPGYEGVFLSGSLVRGNFGCRSVEKASEIGDALIYEDLQDKSVTEAEIKDVLRAARSNSNNSNEYIDEIENEFGDKLDSKTIDNVRGLTGCSDIDMFAFTDLDPHDARKLDDELFMRFNEAITVAEEELVTDSMGIDPGIKSTQNITDHVVTSPEEYARIIERYY